MKVQRAGLSAICIWTGAVATIGGLLGSATSMGQDVPGRVQPVSIGNADYSRIEETLQAVIQENERLSKEVRELREQSEAVAEAQATQALASQPEATALTPISNDAMRWSGHGLDANEPNSGASRDPMKEYLTRYNKGFEIRPKHLAASPYSMKINLQNTFRYTSFSRDEEFWTDSAGTVRPIADVNQLAIPRGRLIFSGNAFAPDVSYLLSIDYNTVNSNPLGFRAYSLSYRFNEALQAHVGQTKVPGTREWLNSSFDTQQGADRSMATTFFRPSLSQGIWVTGQPREGWNYIAMLSNGFNTLNLSTSDLNNRGCGSGSLWWEPLGKYGSAYSDIENHSTPVVRIGSSLTYAIEEGSQFSNFPENSAVRLSDGTLITETGALAPDVTLQSFHLALIAFDVGWKYRGWGCSTEIYRQELTSLRGNGPIPINTLQTYGGVAQFGYFVVPQKLEFYSRNSFVTGAYGSGTEIGTGFNVFPMRGKTGLRFTFDTAWLDSSPADQSRTGFAAGQSGWMFRTQLASSF
ncbi:MAG: porin [Pirellula sp.]